MPRRPQIKVVSTSKGHKVDIPASLSGSRRRERYFYHDDKAAGKHAAAIRKAYHERGTQTGVISPALAEDALKAIVLLEPFGVGLLEAVKDYVRRNDKVGSRMSMGDAWQAYIAGLRKKKRADATIADYERDRRSIPESFFSKKVGEINEESIALALDEATSNRGKTWNRRLREVRAVMRAALDEQLSQVSIRRKDPEILTHNQAVALMDAARIEGCTVPFALMLFGGIRPLGELSRISWGNIGAKNIRISGEESKTADDRLIPISNNLAAWLKGQKNEPLLPSNWQRKYQTVRKSAGLTDEQDILRHTFGSAFYRLQGPHETMQAMGHTSFRTFEKFYKRAMTLGDAQKFFQIAPPGLKIPVPKALKIA